MRPVRIDGEERHQVGLPYHWGSRGLTTGGAANDLTHMALDPNVHIQEVKALSCDIRSGRRPKGTRLPAYVAEVREQAQSRRDQEPHTDPKEVKST
jgi:formate dehydrogenase major subunit